MLNLKQGLKDELNRVEEQLQTIRTKQSSITIDPENPEAQKIKADITERLANAKSDEEREKIRQEGRDRINKLFSTK